jgi:cytochrome b6-f complex iron-sulfur subunit
MDERNPSDPEPSSEGNSINRRSFLNGIAGTAIAIAAIGAVAVSTEYLSPNVLFEPPTSFRIGHPEDYAMNSVAIIPEQQVYIVRLPAGFMALSAVCTHLGCLTQWNPDTESIACPCHGSKFNNDGTVLQGPAPRPLEHFALRVMPDGNLLVDKLEIVPRTQILKA